MPLKAFREIPKNVVEWARYLTSLTVVADEVAPDAINDGSLTYQKIQDVTPDRLLGRDTSPAGSVQELTVSGGLEFTGSGIRRSAITGDVSVPAGGTVAVLRTLLDADIPSEIARDVEVTAAIAAHAAAGDPHPTYTTAAELAAALSALNLASGTYTPTLTNVANVDTSTPYSCQYMRVGSVVTVSGRLDVNATTATISTQVGISLPIASNFTASSELGGTAVCFAVQQSAAIVADSTNDRAFLQYVANDTADRAFGFTFTYRII